MLHGRTANRGASERNFHRDNVIIIFIFIFLVVVILKKLNKKNKLRLNAEVLIH